MLQKNINYRRPRHHSESDSLSVFHEANHKLITATFQVYREKFFFFITLKISSSKKSSRLFET